MASSTDINSIKVADGVDGESSDGDYLGPGACSESILITTDSFEEFANEMSSSLDDNTKLVKSISTISEIQSQIGEVTLKEEPGLKTIKSADDLESLPEKLGSVAGGSSSSSLQQEENMAGQSEKNPNDYINSPEWVDKKKHVFVLSSAGKPIYSRYGNEDKLAGLCGVIQALVSVVQNQKEDVLRSIHTQDCKAVFLVKGPLILVSVSKSNESETQLVLQLTYAFNQIVSILTLTQLNRIFEQRRNYDLRRLLSGAERLIDHLLTFMEEDPAFLLGAVRCLPLPPSARENITSTIISACNKIKDLVFAILLAGNQLITLVRMKKYTLHPSDIHLLINLVRSSESFKAAESWTPICLPKFDATGFLHGHVSYISEDCQACLLLLTVQRDAFFILSQAKHTISEKLRRTNCLVAINDSLNRKKDLPTTYPLKHIGVPEMRHFMYKSKSAAQLFSSDPVGLDQMHSFKKQDVAEPPKDKKLTRLSDIDYVHKYRALCSQIHCTGRPAKLIYKMNSDETILAWVTNGFEVYITFDPLMDKNSAIVAVNKLLRWIEKEQEKIFIMGAPTF